MWRKGKGKNSHDSWKGNTSWSRWRAEPYSNDKDAESTGKPEGNWSSPSTDNDKGTERETRFH